MAASLADLTAGSKGVPMVARSVPRRVDMRVVWSADLTVGSTAWATDAMLASMLDHHLPFLSVCSQQKMEN